MPENPDFGWLYVRSSGLSKLDTTGSWDLSAQTLNLATFTFSSTTTIPSSVPDGVSTVVMLGGSLIGLGLIGRKQCLAKVC